MSEFGAWGSDEGSTSTRKAGDTLQPVRMQMETLTRDMAEYQYQINGIGSFNDNAQLRSEIKSKRNALTGQCQTIKADIQKVSSAADPVQVDRLTTQFLDQVKRLEAMHKDAAASMDGNHLQAGKTDRGSDERTPLTSQQQQYQIQQIDLDLAEQRKNDLISVERDMSGLRDAFVDLNNLVQEQGEDIIKIENATSSALDHTEDATKELTQALVNQRKARKKCFILLGLVITVIIVIIIIIVIALKPWDKKSN